MARNYLQDAPGSDELAPTRLSLLERLRDLGDNVSWQEFLDTYGKLIYGSAVKFGLSAIEAEEVVQETVIGVARKMETFVYDPETCSFKGWLMHITRRRVIDHLRKRQSQRTALLPLPPEQGTTLSGTVQIPDAAAQAAFEGMWETEWQQNLLNAAMERVKKAVPPKQFQIFYMHSAQNMPAADISQLLGVSTAKVYVVAHRLGKMVEKEVRALESKEAV